jgi:chaperonin cofactor prefoldin
MIGKVAMPRVLTFILLIGASPFFSGLARAQEQSAQMAVLQKLSDIENRLNEMDKRYEIRFATLEGEIKRMQDKIEAVNTRIDEKFNLIVGLLGIIVALLALPYVPKVLERFKVRSENREEILRLQQQIEQIKTQLAKSIGPVA